MFSWEYGFIEDKIPEVDPTSTNLLRKNEGQKSGKALTNPLKGRVQSETPHTIKTAEGAVYRKTGIAQSKMDISDTRDKSPKKDQSRRSPHGDEPKSKSTKKEGGSRKKSSDSEEMPEMHKRSNWESTVEFFQDSNENVTSSKDLEVNGGLNLAIKRIKPNNAVPILGNVGGSETQSAGRTERKPTGQEARKQKAAVTARQKFQMEEESSSPEKAGSASKFSPRKELKDKSKEITQQQLSGEDTRNVPKS